MTELTRDELLTLVETQAKEIEGLRNHRDWTVTKLNATRDRAEAAESKLSDAQERVKVLEKALEDISALDPPNESVCPGRCGVGGLCLGCVARQALRVSQ